MQHEKLLQKPYIYSIGTSTRSEKDFLNVLKHFRIETVVDVRSVPKSRFQHFGKENLKAMLETEGISYLYYGKELGGFRKEEYRIYTTTPAYKKGIARLEQIGRENLTTILCAEKLPWMCHRIFIGDSLGKKGFHVIHIIDERTLWEKGSV